MQFLLLILFSLFCNIASAEVINYHNGDIYEGDFVNDAMTGKGTFKYPDGAIYEGDFVNNKIIGKGTIKSPDGSSYEGD